MIIVPQALILSAAATATPMTHTRIGYQTWLRDLDSTAVTVSSESDEAPKDAPLREDTYEYWQPTALPATWQVDMGAARDVDYVGLVGRFGTAGVSVEVETSTNAVDWEALSTEVAPADDAPLMFLDDVRVARHIRITLAAGGPSALLPQLAVCYAGEALAMERSVYGGIVPPTLARKTERYNAFSRGGQFLGQGYRRHGIEAQVPFRYLTAAWMRSDFDVFVKAARGYPFFFAWRPDTFPLEVAYAWTPGDVQPSNMGVRDFMQVSIPLQGIGHE
jgi:hypothetical protein